MEMWHIYLRPHLRPRVSFPLPPTQYLDQVEELRTQNLPKPQKSYCNPSPTPGSSLPFGCPSLVEYHRIGICFVEYAEKVQTLQYFMQKYRFLGHKKVILLRSASFCRILRPFVIPSEAYNNFLRSLLLFLSIGPPDTVAHILL